MEHYSYASPHPVPLQTCNILNDRERSRLVRSTRKLGAVLGATPQLAENVSSYANDYRIALPPCEPSSSTSTPRSSSSSSAHPLLRPARRHASISEHPTRTNTAIYACPSSASSTVSLAPPPARTSSLTVRARKPSMKFGKSKSRSQETPRPLVLRLTSAPRALTLPSTPKTPKAPKSPSPSAGSSLLSAPRTPGTPSTLGSPTPTATPTTPAFPSATETRRRRMAKLTRTLGEIIPPHLVFGAKKPAPPSGGPDENVIAIPIEVDVKPVELAPAPRTRQRRSMSVDFGGQEGTPFMRSSKVWVTGNSMWRGEWNRKDIRDVQKGLRSLKAR